jgi:dUTP pyrophosphatase
VVGTGIAVALPPGYAGFVVPRSGLALRHGLSIVNAPGLVDSGYRGELRVILVNHDPLTPVTLARGDRIAQLVVQRVERVELVEVAELPASERGTEGFGSTGV